MSESNNPSALQSLLQYRFIKKNSTPASTGTVRRENSSTSNDSQETIVYQSQNSIDSQTTIINSQDINKTVLSPASSQSHNHSPVFKSTIRVVQNTPTASPDVGPWISKNPNVVQGQYVTPTISRANVGFRRIKRPLSDSEDDEQTEPAPPASVQPSPSSSQNTVELKVDQRNLERMKEMFPGGNENRMRAALVVYPKNFEEAIKFMVSDPDPKSQLKMPTYIPPYHIEKKAKIETLTASENGYVVTISALPTATSQSDIPECFKTERGKKDLKFLQTCFKSKDLSELSKVYIEKNHNLADAVSAMSYQYRDVVVKGRTPTSSPQTSQKPAGHISKLSFNVHSGASQSKPAPKSISLLKQNNPVKSKGKKAVRDVSDEEDMSEDEMYSGESDDSEEHDTARPVTEKDNYLQFFNEATVEELSVMPGCSKKKAELIISLRPFETWEILHEKIGSQKSLNTALISGCREIMQVRNAVTKLMLRCENISKQMGHVASQLTSSRSGGSQECRITKQPSLLVDELTLQPYQLIGLSWLRLMHEQELNGILADEMGLGKTIQAIAFIAHLLDEGEEGPHVIIVPSSTIENWLREIKRWCPALKTIVYYGSQEERKEVRHSIFFQNEQFHVMLTTYNMATGSAEDRVLFKKYEFHYAVFDEGHMLKNMSSLRFQNLMKISAERRLLLTGTPLQNSLLELMSLLCFVMPDIFQGKTEPLKKVFAMICKSEDKQSRFEKQRIAQAKRIMKPFVLRRLKKDVLQNLPNKREVIEKCSLIPTQQELYDKLVTKCTQQEGESEETTGSGGINVFMQFRKIANHPLLMRSLFDDSTLKKMAKSISKEPSHRERGALPHLIEEDMSYLSDFELRRLCDQYKKYLGKYQIDDSIVPDSGKFRKLDVLLPEMKERGDRVLLFSQFTMMLDIIEVYLELRGHKYIRLDGQTPVPDRLQLIDRFNNEEDIFIFLLSTRAGGVGINLAAANTIILHDIDFNPYNDKQAEDRCHRLGQKREVTVYKLICEDTVDEAMLRCANDKLALEKDLTGSQNEESEENAKDVAKLLKEVLRSRQKKMESSSTS